MGEWAKQQAGSNPIAIVAEAQLYVVPFYTKLGYVPEGGEIEVDGAPHQKMVAHIAPASS